MKTKSMLLKAQKLTPKEMGFVEGGTNEADKPLDGGTLDEVKKTSLYIFFTCELAF